MVRNHVSPTLGDEPTDDQDNERDGDDMAAMSRSSANQADVLA